MPISKKQKQILAFPYTHYDALIADGAIRSGKTVFMMVGYGDWAMDNFNHQRFGICGKTVDSAVKNLIDPYVGLSYAKKRYRIRWKRSEKLLILMRGNVVNTFEVFGGKDESSYMLIQGRTLAGVLLDEVALMPRSFVEQACARCSVSGSKLWFNCNPEGPEHWFYKEWILKAKEKNALRIHFELTDNPSLDESIRQRYMAMYSGVFYERYILGKWVMAEGLVYDMFSREKYVIDSPPEDMVNRGDWYISIDYGTMNPFSAGLWCVYGGKAVRVREYYYSGRTEKSQKTDEEYYQEVERLAGDLNIRRIIIDPSAASFIATIRSHGRFSVRKAKNDVMPGIMVTAGMLKAGILQFCSCCEGCIREFGLYSWDDKAKDDRVIKENDHAMDDMRYFCYTVLRREPGIREMVKDYEEV